MGINPDSGFAGQSRRETRDERWSKQVGNDVGDGGSAVSTSNLRRGRSSESTKERLWIPRRAWGPSLRQHRSVSTTTP